MKSRVRAFLLTTFFLACSLILILQDKSLARDNPAVAVHPITLKAHALPLNAVRLTGGPLKVAQDQDAKYLLELEPDRMLAFLRQRAGLQPKAQPYGGWDGAGRQLTGHIAGHYLSAVSLMWAATGDVRFKERADYIVKELKEVQDKQGDGYIGALTDAQGVDGKKHFEELSEGNIRSAMFDLNGMWSPWYVEHKIFAGLRDAYRYTGNRTALDVEIKFAAWAEHILAPLNDDQIQKMLGTEFGGMDEVTADLYADTGDARWLALSDKFEHRAVVDPLAAHEDILAHKHGNALVPKLYGDLKRYILTGNETDGRAAEFFWEAVALHHSFATGGHGKNEYFGEADKLSDMVDGRTAESCNVYNMLKFTRELFCVNPDIRYADFHERALFNHVLGSQDPDDGRVCYMVPVGHGVQHEYQRPFDDFTCCVGTGMENHALHGYGIYYESENKLWVNLYAPTRANWESAGVTVEMQTDLPMGQSATLRVTPKSPREFTIALRRPYWSGDGFGVKVNGKPVQNLPGPDSYVELKRKWKSGDTVELVLPKTLREEKLPDNPNRFAVAWGPLVLAGDIGPEISRRRDPQGPPPARPAPAPVLVAQAEPVDKWLKPVEGKPGMFRTEGVGLTTEVNFVPFYQLPARRYAIYWDMYTPQEMEKISAAHAAQVEQQKKLEDATVSFVQPGQPQADKDFNQQGEETMAVQGPRPGRRARKWFSYDLPLDPAPALALVVTYSNDAFRDCMFDVSMDGKKLGEQKGEHRSPEQDARFFDITYVIPPELVQGKQKVTVRFETTSGNEVSGVYGIRIIRADALR